MSLILCPECGKYVSSKADICIHCGYPLTKEQDVSPSNPTKSLDQLVLDADEFRVSGDYTNALRLYEQAGKLGNTHAQVWAGNFYDRGIGTEKDYNKAIFWFEKAASSDDATALNNLGVMYAYGKGVPKNVEKAIELYLRASEAGNSQASENLGCIYELGNGISQNYQLAYQYYSLAVQQGSENSTLYNNLAVMYMDGKGTHKDLEKAKILFEKAIRLGSKKAIDNLNVLNTLNTHKSSNKLIILTVCMFACLVLGLYLFVVLGSNGNPIGGLVYLGVFSAIGWLIGKNTPKNISDNVALALRQEAEKKRNNGYRCPNCGRMAGHPIGTFEKGASIGFWGLASNKVGKTYKCANCDYIW